MHGPFTPLRRSAAPRRGGARVALLVVVLAGGAVVAAPLPAAEQRLRAWGDGGRLELLPVQQSSLEVLARSQVTLLIQPHDLPRSYAELLITSPPTLDGRALAGSLRLCRIEVPRESRPVHCLERLPLRLEASRERLRLLLETPLAPQGAYGLKLLLRNPLQQGFHPLRLFGLAAQRREPEYLGTWLLQTFAQSE